MNSRIKRARPKHRGKFMLEDEWHRFMSYVALPGERGNTTQCWLWRGAITSSGHGSFTRSKAAGGRTVSAHKFSYEHFHGPVPEGSNGLPLHVRHKCDTKPCVCPNDLIPGTRSDNMRDMIERNRGRMQFGSPGRVGECQPHDDGCPF